MVKATMKWHSTTPAPPLMVCAARNMAFRLSLSLGSCSSRNRAGFHLGQLLTAFTDEYAGDFVHGFSPVFGGQDASAAGMMSGSPSSAARLQKSITARTD